MTETNGADAPQTARLWDHGREALAARPWAGWLLALLLGAAASWTQAPASFWPALFLCLPMVYALWRDLETPRAAALLGLLFGLGYFIPGLRWIGSAFLVEADKFAWLMPFAITLLPALLSLFWAAAFAAALLIRRRAGPLGGAAALALTWSLAEWLRGHVLTGFPWGLFGFAWIDAPVAQSVAWIGPYGLTALTLALGVGAGVAAIAAIDGDRRLGGRLAAGVVAVLAVLWTAGALRSPAEPGPRAGPIIRLVQPNVPQTEKWVERYVRRNFQRLLTLSEAPAVEPPGLVVWPETATPFMIDRRADLRELIMSRLPAQHLVVGSQRYEGDTQADRRWYNSLFVVGEAGRIDAVYDKHHLVPFGEFLPFQETLQSFGIAQLAGRSTGFSTGPGPQTIATPGLPRFAALICYEAIFPGEIPGGDARPDLLLQVTNDAWFGDSGGPRQHLAQARMRAIEQGLPFVRSANTGVSASIDPYGRIEKSIPLNRQGAIDVRVAQALPPTLYARVGDLGFWILLLALAGFVAFAARGDSRKNEAESSVSRRD